MLPVVRGLILGESPMVQAPLSPFYRFNKYAHLVFAKESPKFFKFRSPSGNSTNAIVVRCQLQCFGIRGYPQQSSSHDSNDGRQLILNLISIFRQYNRRLPMLMPRSGGVEGRLPFT